MNSLYVSCEYPKIIINRKYSRLHPDVKRLLSSQYDYWLKVPCGKCVLCRARTARDWKVRLHYEMLHTPTHCVSGNVLPRCVFLTFTIAPEYYTDDDSFFAPWLKRFRDSYRKCFGNSPRYWCITDRGSQFARLHLHMLLFNPYCVDKKSGVVRDVSITELKKHKFWWKYGFVDAQWVNSFSVNDYLSGYVTGANLYKEDPVKHGKAICEKALRYIPKVYPSKGIGKGALTSSFLAELQSRYYQNVSLNGYIYGLPRYYLVKSFEYLYGDDWKGFRLDGRRWHINTAYNDFIYNRSALNSIEEQLYMYKSGFDVGRFKFSYKGNLYDKSLLDSTIHLNKRYLPFATPTYNHSVWMRYLEEQINYTPLDPFGGWYWSPKDKITYDGLYRGYLPQDVIYQQLKNFPY